MSKLGEYTIIRTGKLDANASSENGVYPFFTCSREPLKIDTYTYDCECVLVAGNGDLNVKYYNGKFDAYQRTYIIESKDKNKLYVPYLYLFLDSYLETLRQQSIGGVIKYIKLGNLTEAEIPLPLLEEQKKIADELDKINALIEKRKEQIEKLDVLVKAKFVEMFGDPVKNPMGWEVNELSDVIKFLTSGSRGWSKYFSEEGEIFLTIKNVKNNKINIEKVQYIKAPDTKEAQRTKVEEQDLLLSITADLGRTGVVTKEISDYGAYINQHLSLIRLDLKKVNSYFISYLLESSFGKNQFIAKNKNGVKAGLNFESIRTLTIIVPPIELQNQFADFVQKVEYLKEQMQEGLEQLEILYKERMQEYFE